MTEQQRLSVLVDLMIVNGRLAIIHEDVGIAWVAAMHRAQSEAAHRLKNWTTEPVVAVALAERSFDYDCDGVYANARWVLSEAPCTLGFPLTYAGTFSGEEWEREKEIDLLMDRCFDDGDWGLWKAEDLGVAVHRAKELCDPSGGMREEPIWDYFDNQDEFDKLDDIPVSPPPETCRLTAKALHGPSIESRLAAGRTLSKMDRMLGSCVLARIFRGALRRTLTGDEAAELLDKLAPPIALKSQGAPRVAVPAEPIFLEEAGAVLDEIAPGVRGMSELDIPAQSFGDRESAIQELSRLLRDHSGLQFVYGTLGAS